MSRKKEPPPQFIAVTADEYELTLGAFDTVKEMCEWSGHKSSPSIRAWRTGAFFGKAPRRDAKCCAW